MLLYVAVAILLVWTSTGHTHAHNHGNSSQACQTLQHVAQVSMEKCQINLPPSYENGNMKTRVNATVYIRHVYGLDSDEILTFGGYVFTQWQDQRLSWNSNQYNNKINLKQDQLWIPDLGFWGSKVETVADFRRNEISHIPVRNDGTASVYFDFHAVVSCPLDMTYFPFDTQQCYIYFGPVQSTSDVFDLYLLDVVADTKRKQYPTIVTGDWYYKTARFSKYKWDTEKNTNHNHNEHHSTDQDFIYYKINIELKRKYNFYMNLVVIPYSLLSFLACIMFFLEESGERVTLAVSIIMAMTVYILIASQATPKSMEGIPLLGVYMLLQMTILIVFTIISIIFLNHYKNEKESPKLNCFKLGKCLFKVTRKRIDLVLFLCYFILATINTVVSLFTLPPK